MAHELHIENGRASMMFVGAAPWHGLGTALDRPATASEAIAAANLDWEVAKKPLLAYDGERSHPVPDRFAIVRKDWWGKPKPVFGIVGPNYQPLQNRDAFAFFDDVVGTGAAIYLTAGALGQGERIWILAKLPDDIYVTGDDITNKFLLLSNSHDGNSSVQIKFTPIRVVCQNTLTMALGWGRGLRVPHFRNLKDRMRNVRDMLGIIDNRFGEIERSFRAMVEVKIDTLSRLDKYLKAIFPDPTHLAGPMEATEVLALEKARENRAIAAYLFDRGTGNGKPGVAGTLWAAYNGVVELVDHGIPQRRLADVQAAAATRVVGKPEAKPPSRAVLDRRLESIWFGDGYSVKTRAFRVAQEWISAN